MTGGAGFIGRHVVAELLRRGARVRVFDNFNDQVHTDPAGKGHVPGCGTDAATTALPNGSVADCEVIDGDIRDREAVRRALDGVDSVVHLAAEVGVGQSMYEIERYVGVNEFGTAVLLQQMIDLPIKRIVVASSMSVYGEGLYRDAAGSDVQNASRPRGANGSSGLASWDPVGADGGALTPVATPESKEPKLSSIYALNKYAQEQMAMIVPPAYGTEAVALRLFNVYGPGQALSNPYTGVLAVFAARLLNGRPPMIYEDGQQLRDFVHVEDVARAFADALTAPRAAGAVINIGSGRPISIGRLAQRFATVMAREDLKPAIAGKRRAGDIRHCFADIDHARRILQYEPRYDLDVGLAELADWVVTEGAVDNIAHASAELESRGLVS